MKLDCRLRIIRADRKLADLAREAGVPASDLSRIETGHALPREGQLRGILRAYDCALTDIYPWPVLNALDPEERFEAAVFKRFQRELGPEGRWTLICEPASLESLGAKERDAA